MSRPAIIVKLESIQGRLRGTQALHDLLAVVTELTARVLILESKAALAEQQAEQQASKQAVASPLGEAPSTAALLAKKQQYSGS